MPSDGGVLSETATGRASAFASSCIIGTKERFETSPDCASKFAAER